MACSQRTLVEEQVTPIREENVVGKLTSTSIPLGENMRLTWAEIGELLNDGWRIGG